MKTKPPPASLPFKGQVTNQATVKWSIPHVYGLLNQPGWNCPKNHNCPNDKEVGNSWLSASLQEAQLPKIPRLVL